MNVATPPTARSRDALTLWAPRLVVAVTASALLLVGIDAGGPLRALTTTLVLLLAPGLAASLAMGPMSAEARTLVTLVGSAALLTIVSMVMALLGTWSPTTGLWICSFVAFALLLVPFVRGGAGSEPDDSNDSDESMVRAPGPTRNGVDDEGGNDHDR